MVDGWDWVEAVRLSLEAQEMEHGVLPRSLSEEFIVSVRKDKARVRALVPEFPDLHALSVRVLVLTILVWIVSGGLQALGIAFVRRHGLHVLEIHPLVVAVPVEFLLYAGLARRRDDGLRGDVLHVEGLGTHLGNGIVYLGLIPLLQGGLRRRSVIDEIRRIPGLHAPEGPERLLQGREYLLGELCLRVPNDAIEGVLQELGAYVQRLPNRVLARRRAQHAGVWVTKNEVGDRSSH